MISRTGTGGIPHEYTGKRWFSLLPPALLGKGMIALAQKTLDPKHYNLGDGGNPMTEGAVAVSEDLASRIISARVKVVPKVLGFTPTGVSFVDGSSLDVDIVVFATGFQPSYAFVDCSDIQGIVHWHGLIQ